MNGRVFGEISWLKLLVCFGLILIVLASERAIRRVLSRSIEKASRKTERSWVDLIVDALFGPVSLFIRVYGIYWALSPVWIYFEGPGGTNLVHQLAGKAADLGGTVASFWFIYRFVFSIDIKIRKWIGSSDNGIHDMLVPLVSKTWIWPIFPKGVVSGRKYGGWSEKKRSILGDVELSSFFLSSRLVLKR